MIHVEPQPEPPDFDGLVRKPGLEALAQGQSPLPPYWRHCLKDLHRVYRGICAYLCIWIPPGTGARSADHFVAKSSHPELAYEWSNYRLVTQLMNSRKGAFQEVLDPFEIPNGWFVLELLFLQVLPNPELGETIRAKVQTTIDRLRLNDTECLSARASYYDDYLSGDVSFRFLEKRCPFVAIELKRQGRVPELK